MNKQLQNLPEHSFGGYTVGLRVTLFFIFQ
ncbi:MAG: hypothetical protein RIR06_1734, partial [Bacteroidota bacterium]